MQVCYGEEGIFGDYVVWPWYPAGCGLQYQTGGMENAYWCHDITQPGQDPMVDPVCPDSPGLNPDTNLPSVFPIVSGGIKNYLILFLLIGIVLK